MESEVFWKRNGKCRIPVKGMAGQKPSAKTPKSSMSRIIFLSFYSPSDHRINPFFFVIARLCYFVSLLKRSSGPLLHWTLVRLNSVQGLPLPLLPSVVISRKPNFYIIFQISREVSSINMEGGWRVRHIYFHIFVNAAPHFPCLVPLCHQISQNRPN